MNYISSLLLGLFISTTIHSQSTEYYKQLNKEGKFNESLQLINKEISQRPSDAELYLIKAEILCLIYQSKTDTIDHMLVSAMECLDKSNRNSGLFVSVSSDVYNLIYRKAAIFMNLEDYRKANEWFKRTLKLHDQLQRNDPMLVFYAGIAAYNAEDFTTMESCFKRLITNNFTIKEPYEMLISYYINSGRTDDVATILQQTLYKNILIDNEVVSIAISLFSKNKSCSSLMVIYQNIL